MLREVLDDAQHHGGPLPGRQRRQRALQHVGVADRIGTRLRRLLTDALAGCVAAAHRETAPRRTHFVHDGPANVRVRVVDRALRPALVGRRERFRHHVFGDRRVAGHRVCEPQRRHAPGLEQLGERAQVVGRNLRDDGELACGRRHHVESDATDDRKVVRTDPILVSARA